MNHGPKLAEAALGILIVLTSPTLGAAAPGVTPTGGSTAGALCDRTDVGAPVALPGSQLPEPFLMPMSSYDDDPFVADSIVECVDSWRFARDRTLLLLRTNVVWIQDEPVIYREDAVTGEFRPFAWNPWPLPASTVDGTFVFPHEPRFPRHEIERDAAGRPVLRDGLQIWKPRDLRRGMSTAFEGAKAAKDAAEFWAGRDLRWGINHRLEINTHAFVGFNAFYAPGARMLFFGVLPYRLPGETGIETIKMFEMASSWEIVVHEAGHALHHELKPNRDPSDLGFRTWGESVGDQMAMWTALRDQGRVRALLAETAGDLSGSNPLSRFGEVFAALVGEGTAFRDAVHDKTVSSTSEEVHDRSEVLTGAAYRLFLTVHEGLTRELGAGEAALTAAGEIMGTFLVRAADFTPENTMSLEDVAKAYLKVDKELYGGRYHAVLVSEFTRREIFDAHSVSEWLAHEAAVPALWLAPGAAAPTVAALLEANLAQLGIGPDFGLRLQSVTQDRRFGQTIVRVQLTLGRGRGAVPLDTHGILTFRANGQLADYHGPLPPNVSPEQALALITRGRRLGLDRHGAPLSIVRRPDGQVTAEARILRGEGLTSYIEAFTLANPAGERREVITLLPRDWRIPIVDE